MSRRRTVPAVREDAPLLWEKQKGEGQKAFAAFVIYRDGGATRSLTKVQATLEETRIAGPSMATRWSSRWSWVERVDAWDRDQDRRRTAENDQAIARAREKEALVGNLGMDAVIARLRGDEAGGIEALDVNGLKWDVLPRVAEVSLKFLRAGTGDTPLDVKGAVFVRGEAFQSFAREFVTLALDGYRDLAAAIVELNGQAAPEAVEAIVLRRQDLLLDEGDAMFKRALRS